jgi:DNA-binding MarR family transcriptional regulator
MSNTAPSEETLGRLLGRAHTVMARRLMYHFRMAGHPEVTNEQWGILKRLWEQDGQSQQELANSTRKDRPSITRLIDTMERLEMVKRVPDQQDRRINLIYLTPHGREVRERLQPLAQRTTQEASANLSPEQLETLRSALYQIGVNLSERPEEASIVL